MADGDIPKMDHPLDIPCLKHGAMEGLQPYRAAPEHQEKLGFPGELVPDWKERALEKMAELVEVEAALRETLSLADGASEADLSRLTSVYEQMKPKEAAALFETMDPAFSAGFMARMRPDAAAGILAKLSPQAAYSISAILAGRHALVPKN